MAGKATVAGLIGVVGLAFATPASAAFFGNVQGGADFPKGAASFADTVVSYAPGLVAGNPREPYRGADKALGVPDYAGADTCSDQDGCTFVSLGDGGAIVLRFDDNRLTGSGDDRPDLWVFEIGPDVEDTFVDISMDGMTWQSVGKVFGSTAAIDIDALGFTPDDHFAYVRLTDDADEGNQGGITVGADIDAVGAISTTLVPLPAALPLFLTALAGLALTGWRRAKA